MLLPDVNVWLALTFDSHVHHPTAKQWFDGLSGQICYFCRMTQQGLLRMSTNTRAFGAHALTLRKAWQVAFRSDACVDYTDEPANLEPQWRNWTQNRTFSPHVWNDAYLAAFGMAAGLQLVSFDKGLAQYTGASCKVLAP